MKTKSLLLLTSVLFSLSQVIAQEWEMKESPLMTEWSKKIDINNVLPEYPRPVMQRNEWKNLNGIWEFQEAQNGDILPTGKRLKEQILVPFPWESAISGVRRQIDSQAAWYRRKFTVPREWKGKSIRLNFGAIDWESTIFINGRYAGTHKGGYDPFSIDISQFLKDFSKQQEIIVKVFDPGNDKAIPHGKQNNTRFSEPKGYSYSPSSGIWQTVWIEPVNKNHITSIHTVPYFDDKVFGITVNSAGKQNLKVKISVISDGTICSQAIGEVNKQIYLQLKEIKPWTPDTPYLYDIKAELITEKGDVQDEIKSYSGMRKISLLNENGVQRLALNNEFIFQMGPLDQGYWPDGIYTAPTDEALKWDIMNIKEWGFNMIRKHIKVEPQRWYYWCDKLGILVWQDMPNCFKTRNEEEKAQFEMELQNMIRAHWNHPSIVNWIVFNEHWGIYDCERITENVMKLDPSRLVTGNSGIDARKPSIDYEVGHIKDNHSYRPPHVPLISSKRATVNGEYGAIGYKIEGHIWDTDGPWVHHNYKGKTEATAEYVKFINQINKYIRRGLSGAVYTQWTDVENEMNGLYTYDRKVEKLDKEKVKEANRSTYVKKEQIHGQTDSQHIQ